MASDTMSPEELVQSILDADATDPAHDIAALAHPDYCADLKQRQVFSLKAQSGSEPALGRSGLEGRTVGDAGTLLRGTLQAVFDVGSIEGLEALDNVCFVERVLAALCWSLPPRAARDFWVSSGTVTRKLTPSSNSLGRRLARSLVLPPSTQKWSL